MSTDAVRNAYGSRARELAAVLGTHVAPTDPDRAIIEPWADGVPGRILDVGSGTGRWAGHLAARGHEVEGLEPVEEFVGIARRAHPTVTFHRGSIADLAGAGRRWSGILAWYSLIHLTPDELPDALATLRELLSDDGGMLLSVFTGPRVEAFRHPGSPAYRWPVDTLAGLLEASGFTVTGERVHDGGQHASLSARNAE